MKIHFNNQGWVFLLFILYLTSCTNESNDDLGFECDESISYNQDVKQIVDVSCAISGCHVGVFAWGNFTSYGGLVDKINLVSFKVLSDMSMPPEDSNGPSSLTNEELAIIECWINAGAPENE